MCLCVYNDSMNIELYQLLNILNTHNVCVFSYRGLEAAAQLETESNPKISGQGMLRVQTNIFVCISLLCVQCVRYTLHATTLFLALSASKLGTLGEAGNRGLTFITKAAETNLNIFLGTLME